MSIKSLVKKVVSLLPLANIIIFESIPDLSDNTKAVFDEMIKRSINKKYKCVWLIEKMPHNYPKIKNVRYCLASSKRFRLYRSFAKCFICCNRWVQVWRNGQRSFYLSHGSPIKETKNYYYMPEGIDFCFSASKTMSHFLARELRVEEEKMIALGYPRNDVFASKRRDLAALFPNISFDKCVVWYPTFRQRKNHKTNYGGNTLPIIHDAEQAIALNETAKKLRTLIVLKPHFAQDVSKICDNGLSNIKIIYDDFFKENDITSYEFVGSCDALITDYSSIYYDYTLCDKPIALIWEDYDDYKNNTGFAEGCEQFLVGGEKIYNLSQLEEFIKNIASERDTLKEERNRVCDLVNFSRDARNSERVADFIIKEADLKI